MKKFYDRSGKVYKTERYFRDNSINSVQVIEEVTQKEMLSYISDMECFDDENNNVVILYKNGKIVVLDSDVYRNTENTAEAIEEATAKVKRFCKRDIAAIINSNENTTIVYGRYYITDSGVVEPMTAEEQTEHYTFAENIEEVETENSYIEEEEEETTIDVNNSMFGITACKKSIEMDVKYSGKTLEQLKAEYENRAKTDVFFNRNMITAIEIMISEEQAAETAEEATAEAEQAEATEETAIEEAGETAVKLTALLETVTTAEAAAEIAEEAKAIYERLQNISVYCATASVCYCLDNLYFEAKAKAEALKAAEEQEQEQTETAAVVGMIFEIKMNDSDNNIISVWKIPNSDKTKVFYRIDTDNRFCNISTTKATAEEAAEAFYYYVSRQQTEAAEITTDRRTETEKAIFKAAEQAYFITEEQETAEAETTEEAEQETAEAEATATAEQAAAIENLISFDSKHSLCKEISKLTTGINLLIYDLSINDNNLISNSDVYNTTEIFEKLKKYSDNLLNIAEYTNRLLFDYFKLPYFAEAEQEQQTTAEQENF